MKYGDVLWVDDFDDGDSSPTEEKIKFYYPDRYRFRVDFHTHMLETLQILKNAENFSKYSCAVLDINLTKGFNWNNTATEPEFEEIREILKDEQVQLRNSDDPSETGDYADFKKNAGYYIYLYLMRRGMPASRICMLTGNKGSGNLTEEWEEVFEEAGLIPPKAFDRMECKLSTSNERPKDAAFIDWLNKTLSERYRLRACIMAMSGCALKLLEKCYDEEKTLSSAKIETIKVILKNLYRNPLRLSNAPNVGDSEIIAMIWQLVQPWDTATAPPDKKRLDYAYHSTLKMTRNWLAHRCLDKMNLLTAAFIFGVGMRGLLRPSVKLKPATEYSRWENELLALIKDLDQKNAPSKAKSIERTPIGSLVMQSCQEYYRRISNPDKSIELTSDISDLINHIGQKKNGIQRNEIDLLRNFLHCVYPIRLLSDEGRLYNTPKDRLGFMFEFDDNTFDERKNKIEATYLSSVLNTLVRDINF